MLNQNRENKTKKKTRNHEFSTFDYTGNLNISSASGSINKSFGKDRTLKDTTKMKSGKEHISYFAFLVSKLINAKN